MLFPVEILPKIEATVAPKYIAEKSRKIVAISPCSTRDALEKGFKENQIYKPVLKKGSKGVEASSLTPQKALINIYV